MRTFNKACVAAVGLLGILIVVGVAAEPKSSPVEPLNGSVVVDYSNPKPAFAGTSGIFRDPDDPPEKQFIIDALENRKLPGGAELGFLSLSYVVSGDGAYNGYWWKLKTGEAQDWSRFEKGTLVLRLAKGANCTPKFKFEIKTADKPEGPVTVFPVYVELDAAKTKAAMEASGYADVAIPLKDFQVKQTILDSKTLQMVTKTLVPNLKQVTEFTVVFEQNKIPAANHRGILLVNSIRLIDEVAGK
jgi:hypothetical protein